jgi:acyl-coenzyme A thioesterase 13
MEAAPPEGFKPLFRTSPFLDHNGPVFYKTSPMLTTASVTTDFAGGAKVGDWVEAHVDVHKVGGRLAFANCYLVCNGERIVHASAVFARSGDRG